MSPNKGITWGLLPADVILILKNRYWQKRIKNLLLDSSVFPLKISLKPPKGNQAIDDFDHFQKFVFAWQSFSKSLADNAHKNQSLCNVVWKTINYRALSKQEIPVLITVPDITALADLIGTSQKLHHWLDKIDYLKNALFNQNKDYVKYEQALFSVLIKNLEQIDNLSKDDYILLARLIPQLKPGLGNGCYLRALPVNFVDTKFIENNLAIIEQIAIVLLDANIQDHGLLSWLDCKLKPKDWLLVKLLDQKIITLFNGVSLLRLSTDSLLRFELPAENILVIENEQSCLALENIPNTIAVSGGGKNLLWLDAFWLKQKRVAYWGDVDSEGFSMLSQARSRLSNIVSIMMDENAVLAYKERMVSEPESVSKDPEYLQYDELLLFKKIRSGKFNNQRLEQERLPLDYVRQEVMAWVNGINT